MHTALRSVSTTRLKDTEEAANKGANLRLIHLPKIDELTLQLESRR